MTLCVRRDDRSFMDFSCGPSRWVEEGHVQFRLLPKDTQYLAGAARAWLQLNDGNRQIQSNTVWLLHLDEVNESEKEQESRTLRQFRESGRGLTGYLQNLIDQGAIDRSIDLLDNLRIRYSNDMGRLRPHVLRPRRAISPIREDEEPLAMWRLTSDQRLQLGQAIQDFVERHHDKVLMKHVNNPNPNGLDNFLDVLETCTDLSIKSHQQGLLEGDVIRAMIRSGLGLFSGTVLKEGYSKALRGHMYGHDEELRRALGEYGTAERIATVAIATVCSSPAWKHGKACRAMTLSELVIACGCPQLTTFFEFTREPAADLPARVRACVSNYSEPGFFADIEVVTRAPMPAAPTIHGLEHGGYD